MIIKALYRFCGTFLKSGLIKFWNICSGMLFFIHCKCDKIINRESSGVFDLIIFLQIVYRNVCSKCNWALIITSWKHSANATRCSLFWNIISFEIICFICTNIFGLVIEWIEMHNWKITAACTKTEVPIRNLQVTKMMHHKFSIKSDVTKLHCATLFLWRELLIYSDVFP